MGKVFIVPSRTDRWAKRLATKLESTFGPTVVCDPAAAFATPSTAIILLGHGGYAEDGQWSMGGAKRPTLNWRDVPADIPTSLMLFGTCNSREAAHDAHHNRMTAPATMTIHPQFEWGAGQPEAVYAEPIEALATQVANHAASWTTAPDELDLADMWREIDETARFDGWVLDTGFETLPIVYADPQRRRQRAAEARSHE